MILRRLRFRAWKWLMGLCDRLGWHRTGDACEERMSESVAAPEPEIEPDEPMTLVAEPEITAVMLDIANARMLHAAYVSTLQAAWLCGECSRFWAVVGQASPKWLWLGKA